MPTFIQTLGAWVNLAAVAQIEERSARSNSLSFFDDLGQQLGAVPMPCDVPAGFVQASGVTPLTGRLSGAVQRTYVALTRISRIQLDTANPVGPHKIFGLRGQFIGHVVGAVDLEAAGATIISA
jgi:hypothetical protein